MTVKKKTWDIGPGDPTKLGTTRMPDGYNFAVETEKENPVELIFYKKGTKEQVQQIMIPESFRTGKIWSVKVLVTDLSMYEYEYRQDEKAIEDHNGRLIWKNKKFGELPDKDDISKAGVLQDEDVKPASGYIKYEDLILYKVHVRGYTMQKNSRVRKKGTFAGLSEKIAYWKELGVNAIELMPAYDFEEYHIQEEENIKYQGPAPLISKLNYWGYAKGNYFSPKVTYCGTKQPEKEVKDFISALHEAGMECLMDFYFPKETAPGLVMDVLRFWKMEYKVDGFVLAGDGVWLELLFRDPLLEDTKLICPGYDMEGLYGHKGPKVRRLAEYHMGFQNAMRRFLKGDEDQINSFMYYNKQNPPTNGEIHYMANHDGFTLADMVSYDERHNEENGEENRDGTSYNYSWNCGVEGPTRKLSIQEIRKRQMKNALLMLMLSQGTPLIYGGDELGNSQNGNNNAYCQDNEIGWVDWSQSKKFSGFTEFVRSLIQFRKEHSILHMPYELRPTDYKSLGWPELSYHSERAWFSNTECSSRQLGILYCGGYAKNKEDEGTDDFIYVVYNMHWTGHTFALPDLPEGMKWHLAIDSGRKDSETVCPKDTELPISEKKSLKVAARTILVLLGK
ncbi:MAG: Type II secretory pathway, pullulanase PulA and related glycosidase [Clostridia bacterium]|nr:Type II secretory pathway, pullulanase PulA and related glycosidase [Clostridia bacterium]NCC43911.1 Type II secretory pathway, pullulanase PulA and related glycosidase [Clostridia bacterium]